MVVGWRNSGWSCMLIRALRRLDFADRAIQNDEVVDPHFTLRRNNISSWLEMHLKGEMSGTYSSKRRDEWHIPIPVSLLSFRRYVGLCYLRHVACTLHRKNGYLEQPIGVESAPVPLLLDLYQIALIRHLIPLIHHCISLFLSSP